MPKKEVDEFLKLTVELDAAIKAHGDDSKESDAVRDRMDKPWYALSKEDRDNIEQSLRLNELLSKEGVEDQLGLLFNACTEDVHYQVLEELCITSGLLWRCACGYNNQGDNRGSCDDCGTSRPKEGE